MWLTMNGGGSTRVVQAYGEIDLATAPRLRDQLTEVLHRHSSRVVLDLSGITFCDSSGLAALLGAARRAELLGGELLLASPSSHLRKILALTGLDTIIRTFPTVPTALDMFVDVPAQRSRPAEPLEEGR